MSNGNIPSSNGAGPVGARGMPRRAMTPFAGGTSGASDGSGARTPSSTGLQSSSQAKLNLPPASPSPASTQFTPQSPLPSRTAAPPANFMPNRLTGGASSAVPLHKRDLLMIVTRLSIMVRSGVDLAEAVRSVAFRSTHPNVRRSMGLVYTALENGSSLSEALEDQRGTFGGVMVASVAAGEASGRLTDVLGRLSTLIRDELRLQASVKAAISYPVVLLLVTGIVLAAMVFFVLPQFAGIYKSSRAPTPVVTQWLLDGSDALRSCWWAVLGATAAAIYAIRRYVTSTAGRRAFDLLSFQIPMAAAVARPLLTGRVFRLQGVMLESGVPMLEVLQLTRGAVGNSVLAELLGHVQISIANGRGMSAALLDSPCLPEGAVDMVATAEANGQLGPVLQTIGEFYEAEGEQQLRDLVRIAEPAIIVGLGLVVGAIVLAVMLPLLDLSTAGGM